jgi:DNA-binding MarR family transcriptional regulator
MRSEKMRNLEMRCLAVGPAFMRSLDMVDIEIGYRKGTDRWIDPAIDAAASACIDTMLDFNQLYGEYVRDINMMLIETGMGRLELRVLRHIGPKGANSAWLRNYLDMDRAQVSRTLHFLEASRIVTLAREKPDRRVLQIRATARGQKLLDEFDRLLRPVAWRLLRELEPAERAALAESMSVLSGILRHRRHRSPANALVPYHVPRLRRAD